MVAQSIVDKAICGFNSVRYGISEPLFLAIVRQLNKGFYSISPDEPLISLYTPTYNCADLLLAFAQKNNYEFVFSSYLSQRDGKEVVIDLKDQSPRIGETQTWLYRAYLKFMKYNINCFRKAWNRVNDTDLQDRLFKSGVRMGFLDEVTCYWT